MSKLDNDLIDEATLKLSGIIGVFELIVELSSGIAVASEYKKNTTMLDFAFYISQELQGLYKIISGAGYKD